MFHCFVSGFQISLQKYRTIRSGDVPNFYLFQYVHCQAEGLVNISGMSHAQDGNQNNSNLIKEWKFKLCAIKEIRNVGTYCQNISCYVTICRKISEGQDSCSKGQQDLQELEDIWEYEKVVETVPLLSTWADNIDDRKYCVGRNNDVSPDVEDRSVVRRGTKIVGKPKISD